MPPATPSCEDADPGISVSSPIVWGDRLFVSTAVSSDPDAGFRHASTATSSRQGHRSARLAAHRPRSQDRQGAVDKVAHQGVPKTKRIPSRARPRRRRSPTAATSSCRSAPRPLAYSVKGDCSEAGPRRTQCRLFYTRYEWASPARRSSGRTRDRACDIQQGSFVAASTSRRASRRGAHRDEIPSWATPTVVEMGGTTELVTQAPTPSAATTRRPAPSLAPVRQLRGHGTDADRRPRTFIVTNGYRGVQPIFAIKPGARGDLTLKGDATSSDGSPGAASAVGPTCPRRSSTATCSTSSQQRTFAAYTPRPASGSPGAARRTGGAFSASPVAADGKIYLAAEDGEVFVVKAGRTYELLATTLSARC